MFSSPLVTKLPLGHANVCEALLRPRVKDGGREAKNSFVMRMGLLCSKQMKSKLITTVVLALAFCTAAAFAKDKGKVGAAANGGKGQQGESRNMQVFEDLLKSSDENKDGAVTLEEFLKHQPAGKDAAKSRDWFNEHDRNHDGQLTREDFAPPPAKK